jgi:hypothetical protein
MSRSPAAVISALMTLVAAVSSDKSAEPVKMTSNYSTSFEERRIVFV